ncbi:FAD/NAD(P)-binding protein [Saccharopolyspora pogona]|uniref:FAD/NAD(P)-binding protein n=1 Tax=Saccharopolyspora pogona TaxID=333966 RepID=UPI001689EDDD|nr:FAD/NAD(P)-binding protein [Saccharopolyspora pogona]
MRICVIGAGPRGLAVLERICANCRELLGPAVPVEVDLVDPFAGAGGRVWWTEQSPLLLMNTVASQVTAFTDDSVDCEGPIRPGPSLHEWASADPDAEPLEPDEYPTRAVFGRYLAWFLDHVIATAPPNVTVRWHRDTAVTIRDEAQRQRVRLADGAELVADAVVLAQGHVDAESTGAEQELAGFARRHRLRYVPPSNPSEVDLSSIRPGEPIGLRGLGLNFFDYLALLTAGRGGRFVPVSGKLQYLPSGREPVLFAGSRRGVPYHARGQNQKGVSGRHEPLFLTPEVIAGLQQKAAEGTPPSFRVDVWPLVSEEVRAVYYTTWTGQHRSASTARAFRHAYLRAIGDEVAERAVLRRFSVPREEWWDWDRVTRPCGERVFADRDEFHGWLLEHLERDLAEAERGNVAGPLKAALDVLRDLRNEIRLVIDHGGITGSSYRDEVQLGYTGENAFLSIGPPARRIAELIALIEAGVVHVLGPGMQVSTTDGSFSVCARGVAAPPVRVTTLIEARLPEPDLRRSADPLLRWLQRTGQCAAYRIADPNGAYRTGGLAVTRRPYHLIDAAGRPHPRRFAFGVPTEAVHWVTAAGARPGVNSVSLSDADSIARACLAVPRSAPAPRLYADYHNPLAWLPTSAAR